jgi:hypothetical protein
MIKNGSIWASSDRTKFIVIHTIELDGKNWVHYRLHDPSKAALECKEYSCYEESFVSRFTESLE